MANFSQSLIAYSVIRDIGKKWTDFDAYELGLIDENGKKIKSPETSNEKDAYNSYYRMIFNFKRLLNKMIGKNPSVNKLVSLFLLKEGYEQNVVDDIITKLDLPTDTQDINYIIANTLLESIIEA